MYDFYAENATGKSYFAGNVGIGTTNPSQKLDVAGNIAMNGKAALYGYDGWLRINEAGNFGSGIYAGSTTFRTDGRFEVGGGGDRFVVMPNGNVGIGNGNPGAKLAVTGSATFYRVSSATNAGSVYPGEAAFEAREYNYGGTGIDHTEQYAPRIGFHWGNRYWAQLTYFNGIFAFRNADLNGYVPIVAESVTANSFTYSDITLKKNIATIESPLTKILKLRGVTFDWKKDNKASVGVIAQEVEKVFPELVQTNAEGIKSVEYGNLVAPLIEAVKEQQKEIESLNNRIKVLESKK